MRQRQRQQFQRHNESPTGHAATGMTDQHAFQARGNLLRVQLSKVRAGIIGDHIPIPGRHLPTHGCHLPDGKSAIRRELSVPP